MKRSYLWLMLAAGIAGIVLMLVGCGQPTYYPPPPQQAPVVVQPVQAVGDYQVMQDPVSGQQMAVFYDNGIQMMVTLAAFNAMMNSGGYSYVIHHYHDYPGYVRYDRGRYSNWRVTTRQSYNSYRPSVSTNAFRQTTVVRPPPQTITRPAPSAFRSTTVSRPISTSSFRSSSSSSSGFRRSH